MVPDPAVSLDPVAIPTPRRKFRLSDGMILVAGAALALSNGSHLLVLLADMVGQLRRETLAHRDDLPDHWPVFWRAIHFSLSNVIWYGFQVSQTLLLGTTFAFIIIRARRPRPPWRVLFRQPGAVAGLAIIFGLFWGTGFLYLWFPNKIDPMTAAPTAVGAAVALGWSALILGRWWKPEPTWIDRLGRVLGVLAIGTALVGLVVFRI